MNKDDSIDLDRCDPHNASASVTPPGSALEVQVLPAQRLVRRRQKQDQVPVPKPRFESYRSQGNTPETNLSCNSTDRHLYLTFTSRAFSNVILQSNLYILHSHRGDLEDAFV